MTARRLTARRVAKPWGRRDLPPPFAAVPANAPPVGEIWFEDESGPERPLLVKYLFTSERLSIQVHPGDAAAKAAGHKQGKDEAWAVIAADPGATIGLGLTQSLDAPALRAAALDGSLETLVDWKPARPGDIWLSPAGTIHAIGAGLVVVEVQKNVDLTYRLYDYGRPRALHLDEAVAAADGAPFDGRAVEAALAPGRTLLATCGFVLERWERLGRHLLAGSRARPIWLIPLSAGAYLDGQPLRAGEVWLADGPAGLDVTADALLLAAYPGDAADLALLQVERRRANG